MERGPQWTATCWGGPVDGETITSEHPYFEAARHRRLSVAQTPMWAYDVVAPVPYFIDRYQYERVACGSFRGAAWIVQQPAERSEAIRQTIVDGLNAVAGLARLAMMA